MADNFNTLDQAGTTTSAGITDGTIVNADINASAAIDESKIASLVTDLAAKTAKATLTTKGDLYVASAASTPSRLAVAADNTALLAPDSSAAGGVSWSTGPTITGEFTARDLKVTGMTGAVNQGRFVGVTAAAAPTTGTFAVGDFVLTQSGRMFVCTSAGTPGTWVTSDAPAQPADHGLIAWTQPLYGVASTTALTTAGTVYLRRIRRVPACSVTNIVLALGAGGSSLTTGQCFTALYTSGGVLVGVSADQASAWGSSGVKTAALAGGPFPLTAGDYYIAAWFNGSTGPSLARNGLAVAAIANMGLAAPNLVTASSSTGITTTAPDPFGAQTSYTLEWWAALS